VTPPNISRPKRAFVLGAGASACCGLPITNRLLPEVLPFIEDSSDRKRLLKFVAYQYPHFNKTWRNYPNLEEFLGLMDVYLQFSSKVKTKHAFEDKEVTRLRRELLRAISTYLCDKAQYRKLRGTQLFSFAKRLVPGDVVITLNWDFLLELALFKENLAYSYVHDHSKISILKLHGSVDWFDRNSISLRPDRRFDLIPSMGRLSVYRYFAFPTVKKKIVPVIIPPVARKDFDHPEFHRLFKDAWAALRWAGSVHIIGFSLPPEDLHVRFLIRSALRMNEQQNSDRLPIAVVNPDRDILLRFARLVHSPIKFFEARFEDVSLDDLLAAAPAPRA
jgi:hypothetical protein